MVTFVVTALVVIGVVVGVLLYLKNKDKPAGRFNAIPTEERNAQLEARYQERLRKERGEQLPPASGT